ncbi:MAG TPA: hypothetical protein ENK85_07425 [Saprospiraceae bacterium]|nr:hypothetical protein [Saprospiraceae bacterium]
MSLYTPASFNDFSFDLLGTALAETIGRQALWSVRKARPLLVGYVELAEGKTYLLQAGGNRL